MRAARNNDASCQPTQKSSRGITISSLVTEDVVYPLLFVYSGDDVSAVGIKTKGAYRSYFPYGVRNHSIEIESESPRSSDINLTAYGPSLSGDLEHISVRYTNTESTSNGGVDDEACFVKIAPLAGCSSAAVIRNIQLDLNIRFRSGGHSRGVVFYRPAVDAQNPAYPHEIDNITIRGHFRTDTSNRGKPIHTTSEFGSGTLIKLRNLLVEQVVAEDTEEMLLYLHALQDQATFLNVRSTRSIRVTHGGLGRVTMIGCHAPNLSYDSGDGAWATYINCDITDGSAQAFANKTLINSKIGASQPVSMVPEMATVLDLVSTYNAKPFSEVILVKAIAAGTAINLPHANPAGRKYTIKRLASSSGSVVVYPVTGQKIDDLDYLYGASALTGKDCVVLLSDGSNWIVLSRSACV